MSEDDRLAMGPGRAPRGGEAPARLPYGTGYRDVLVACHEWLLRHDLSYRREQAWYAAHRPGARNESTQPTNED